MPLSVGLDTAISAMRASQIAVDTASNNIANVSTEGYSRQEVSFRAIPPTQNNSFAQGGGASNELGQGVESVRIRRFRDEMLDNQYRNASRLFDEYSSRADALKLAEVTLNEPSDHGLQAELANFYNAFRDVGNQPESVAARTAAVETAVSLVGEFNRLATQFRAQQTGLDDALETKVLDVNAYAQEIAGLNAQIRRASTTGTGSNYLEDRRDLLMDKIGNLIGATFEKGTDNTINVIVNGRKLVDNVTVDEIKTQPDPLNSNLKSLVFTSDNSAATPNGGVMLAMLDSRDVEVAKLLTSLNELAGTLVTAVNGYHRTGYGLNNATGLDFFTGTDAGTIGVSATLQSDPQNLAASSAVDEPGNVSISNKIAGVQFETLMNGNTATIEDAYRIAVARLGVVSRQMQQRADNQDLLTRHLSTERQAVTGVNVDEEMLNITQAEHSYKAAARVISIVDSILDTLINDTIR